MNLSALLKELRCNILRDRSNLYSGPSDQLWDDETLVSYIDAAQKRFARLTLCIKDGTTDACCSVTIEPGIDTYLLHPSVLSVFSAKFQGDTCDLARAGHKALGSYTMPDTYFFDPGQLSNLPPGKVMAYSTDEGVSADEAGSFSVVTLRAYPMPGAGFNTAPLQLRVSRLPINDLTLQNLAAVPEIPEIHHLEMLDWAAYLALRVGDHDAEDYKRALNFKALFDESIENAKKAMRLKTFAPTPWGLGRNGFSWANDANQ